MTTGRSRAVASCAAEFDESSRLRPSVPAMTSVERWEKRAEIPLLLLAVAFLIAYAWPVLNPRLDPNLRTILDVASWTVWAAFLIDFIGRLYFAHERRKYALTHWYDVALITLPMLRPLRLLRLLAFARVLNRSAAGSLVGRISAYVAGTGVVALGLGALSVLDAEQRQHHHVWRRSLVVSHHRHDCRLRGSLPCHDLRPPRRGWSDARGDRLYRCDHSRGRCMARRSSPGGLTGRSDRRQQLMMRLPHPSGNRG
jgi:hypothetical protein